MRDEGGAVAEELRRDTLFVALTRPQMFAGVTYSYFVINAILTVELFLMFKSFKVLLAGLVIHLVGALVCLREPRFFDLWIARVRYCPRVRNFAFWQCNSYRP
ncbi:type IV secretion system protein VirB3 [Caulobacter sp.]|uniref:type IV secretion system protein VirB3 n=1 Tax=Caulobacter sp. TaxID=78 RepID=UPI001B2B2C98|nr:type IV secretion system protein VirB3 [Caulobacter sp.]MBO9547458.1 type IV secretion system protein VirB3 [Caulobacter sp.]